MIWKARRKILVASNSPGAATIWLGSSSHSACKLLSCQHSLQRRWQCPRAVHCRFDIFSVSFWAQIPFESTPFTTDPNFCLVVWKVSFHVSRVRCGEAVPVVIGRVPAYQIALFLVIFVSELITLQLIYKWRHLACFSVVAQAVGSPPAPRATIGILVSTLSKLSCYRWDQDLQYRSD